MTLYRAVFNLVIEDFIEKEKAHAWANPTKRGVWLHYRNERVARTAEFCAQRWSGDLLEIGCYTGNMTAQFANIARRYNRRVIAIDPWIPGVEQCNEYTYALFQRATRGYDNIDVLHKPSQDMEAKKYVQRRELCFAYIDGRHTYPCAKSDINITSHCNGIIVLDDVDSDSVSRAMDEMAPILEREILHEPHFIEAYLL